MAVADHLMAAEDHRTVEEEVIHTEAEHHLQEEEHRLAAVEHRMEEEAAGEAAVLDQAIQLDWDRPMTTRSTKHSLAYATETYRSWNTGRMTRKRASSRIGSRGWDLSSARST